MEHKLHGAVVGCGPISEWRLRAWRRIQEVEIVALVDRNAEKAQRRTAHAPEAHLYTDIDAAIECENLDFVDILTPPGEHVAQCMAAKAASLHIICRQPLCDNVAEAQRLVQAAASYPHVFATDGSHRYREWFRRLTDMQCAGRFGNVAMARFEEVHSGDGASEGEAHGGVWLECGTQVVDLMRSLLGEPTGVYARMHKTDESLLGENLVHALYEYPGATAIIDVAWTTRETARGSVMVAGDKGEAFYEAAAERGGVARFRVTDAGVRSVVDMRPAGEDYAASIYRFQREAVDAMLGRGTAPDVEDHLKTLEYVFAAYRSAAEGLPVGL